MCYPYKGLCIALFSSTSPQTFAYIFLHLIIYIWKINRNFALK